MGTDIHIIAEQKIDGIWHAVNKAIFPNPDYELNSSLSWQRNEYTVTPYEERNYILFGILAGVANNDFCEINSPKGFPNDLSEEAFTIKEPFGNCPILYKEYGFGASYLTLEELIQYPWNKPEDLVFFISEENYRDYLFLQKKEIDYEKYFDVDYAISLGHKTVYLTPEDMNRLIYGKMEREGKTIYYTNIPLPSPYEYCKWFVDRVLPILTGLVPKNGTKKDVRIIFNFDN